MEGRMRKTVRWLAGLALLGVIVWQFGTYRFARGDADIDLRMRYFEATSVRQGQDPFLIWNGTVTSDEFTPWSFAHYWDYRKHKLVHAYTPWTYALMLPLTFLPVEDAGAVYLAVQILVLFGLLLGALVLFRRRTGDWLLALAGIVLLTSTSDAITRCLIVGNFGLLITGAVFAAIVLQERGRECLAGVFWAVALVKPQIGGLFFLLLLFERRWKVVASCCVTMAVGTLVASALCHRSPVEMILAIREYSVGQFGGTGLFCNEIAERLSPWLGEQGVLATSMGIGMAVCLWSAFYLRKQRSLFVRMLPAATLSLAWSTSRLHDYCIQMVAYTGLLLLFWEARGHFKLRAAIVMTAVFCIERVTLFNFFPYDEIAQVMVLLLTPVICWLAESAESKSETGKARQ